MSTATPATSKKTLLHEIGKSYRTLRSALEALPRERFTEKLSTGWSLNENLAHLAAWEETVPRRVAAVLESGEDPKLYGDIDTFNARAATEAAGKTSDELFARWSAAHDGVLETIRSIPEDAERLAFEVVEWNTTGHYPDHFADIDAAIRTKEDLFALVQTNWIAFRLAIGAIGLPALEGTTSSGWTYKDLVAHAGAWEDHAARRLAGLRETGATSEDEVANADEFNARVVERTRGRSPADVIRELDAAHERFLEEMQKLAADHMRAHHDWIVPVVALDTYGHYAGHFDEVFAAVPKKPSELLERMREGWRPFRRGLNRLGLMPLADKTPAGWTYRGMVGHVANWMEKIPGEMPNRLAGRRGPTPDVDAENAREAKAGETRSAHDAVKRLDDAYRSVVDLVTALPADRDIPFLATRLIVGETYGHFVEHGGEIEAALPRTADDFVRSIERVWKPFRATIRERGRAGLGEPTATGWTYKNLIAHSIGWMEQTIREMRTGELSSGWTKESIDAFNERSVRTHELVGPEAIVDELDTVYRNLVETVRGLGGGPIDERFAGTMPYYTYLHWEEHLVELGIPL